MLPVHAAGWLWIFLLPAWPLKLFEVEMADCAVRSMIFFFNVYILIYLLGQVLAEVCGI